MKNIIIFGGDGFCGWPAALHLSNIGYNVTIVDNLSRRMIDVELGVNSLTPIIPIMDRVDKWKELTGKEIEFYLIDVSDHYHRILSLLKEKRPIAVVHYAEQRAAPYSMRSSYHKRYTINNNINATNNILCAIVESGLEIHMVHLGTTGTAGYVTTPMDIPEGYFDVKVMTDEGEIEMEMPWPLKSPSHYHLTKSMDFLMFEYFNNNDNLRCTDLRQGIIWGCETAETRKHPDLINRWDYDHWYGTCLNRFLIQSQIGHPLTIYGTGGQTRAFINIEDSVKCIQLAIENPPSTDKVRVLNQMTECHNILQLAQTISYFTGSKIKYYQNPRKEAKENKLRMTNKGLIELGLKPITLHEGLLREISETAGKYKDRCNKDKIMSACTWSNDIKVDLKEYDTPQ